MFKVPIHLALGHECIAVAVNSILNQSDDLILHTETFIII